MKKQNNTVQDNTRLSMLHDAKKAFDRAMRKETAKNGSHSAYNPILALLVQNGRMSQLEIAAGTGLKPPTVSTTLKNMERDGLISRRKDNDDGRVISVTVTEKGAALNDMMRQSLKKTEDIALADMTAAELEALNSLLSRIALNLTAASEQEDDTQEE